VGPGVTITRERFRRRERDHFSALPTPGLSIAAIAGALALIPENADHEHAIYALLQASSSVGDVPCAAADVRALIDRVAGPPWEPTETLFTTRVPFWSGDRLAFTGGFLELDDAIRRLVPGLFLFDEASPAGLAQEATRLVCAVLDLGDHLVRAAGLSRHVTAELTESIIVPPTAEFERLIEAVSFTPSSLDSVTGGHAAALAPLTANARDVAGGDGIAPFGVTPW